MIYIIGNKEQNICKIGYSKRPYRRIETLQKTIPLKLHIISIFEGDFIDEQLLHDKYHEFRIKGEWFYLDKIEEAGIELNNSYLTINDIIFIIDKENKLYHVNSLVAEVNKHRIKKGLNSITWNSFVLSNKDFINSFATYPIIKKKTYWVHPFVAIELIRSTSVEFKIMAYSNLDKFMLL
jgi:hypothetical protein